MRSDTSRFVQAALAGAALAVAAGTLAELRSRRTPAALIPDEPQEFEPRARRLTRQAIEYFLVPVWSLAGLADWWCHRRGRIERNAGIVETWLHLLMLLEAAVPVVAGLLFEINPLMLSGMIAAFFLHEATAMVDVDYAMQHRDVSPLEQHVHSFLEMVPLATILLVGLLHWPQVEALAGRRASPPSRLTLKREPLPRGFVATALAAMLVLGVAPYTEELLRDLRFSGSLRRYS